MIKLVADFEAPLDLGTAFTQTAAPSKILPFDDGRAVVFGWGTQSGQHGPSPHGYWFADLRRDGVSTRVLPTAWTHGSDGAIAVRRPSVSVQAFRCGERVGLLPTSDTLLLFDDIHAEPARIPIEHHFEGLSEHAHAFHSSDSHFQVVHCGQGSGSAVPVVLSSPTGRGAGRHLALLEIDAGAGRARWLHTLADGSPRTLDPRDYAGFDPSGRVETVAQLDPQVRFPVVGDCAWIDRHWLVYVLGNNPNVVRHGIPVGVLSRNHVDLALLEPVFRPSEPSQAVIATSLDRLIVSPLHKNGARKGRQTVFTFADAQEHEVKLPRGCSRHQVLEHAGGTTWLAPMPAGYNALPVSLLACREA